MKQLSQPKRSMALIAALMALSAAPAFAQVATVATQVNTTLNGFLYVISGVGLTLFTAALVLVAYKYSFVEGTKFSDLKGLVIGGALFGAAAAIAGFLVNGS